MRHEHSVNSQQPLSVSQHRDVVHGAELQVLDRLHGSTLAVLLQHSRPN